MRRSYVCTLPVGHRGAHVQFDNDDRLLAAWQNRHG
jgi:hypothetical protein